MLFRDVIGQQEVKNQLIATVEKNRISHAQLFYGPDGSGKLPMAIAYAQYICCTDRKKDDSCGICDSCIKFVKISHPDVHFSFPYFIDKKDSSSSSFIKNWRALFLKNPYFNLGDWQDEMEGTTKQSVINVTESEEILKKLSLKSYESEFKFLIMWHAEKLNIQASNKLLKIIEEPPDNTVFILITQHPDNLLKTIQSRLQSRKFSGINDQDITVALKKKAPEISDFQAIVRMSNGDYNMATKLMVDVDTNMASFERFQFWMRKCFQFSIQELSAFSEEMAKEPKEWLKCFFQYSIEMLRQCFLMNHQMESLVKSGIKETEFLSKFAPYINFNNLKSMVTELDKAIFHLERNANTKLLFLDISLNFSGLFKAGGRK